MKEYVEKLYTKLHESMEKPVTLGSAEEVGLYAKTIRRLEQTSAVADARGIGRDVPRWAWGVAMNMMYSDYYGVAVDFGVNRPEFYAALAEAFLMDKDGPGPEEKLCAYYRGIVERGR